MKIFFLLSFVFASLSLYYRIFAKRFPTSFPPQKETKIQYPERLTRMKDESFSFFLIRFKHQTFVEIETSTLPPK